MTVRPATADDLPAIAAIQRISTEAAQWNPAEYLDYRTTVAISDGAIVGFLVTRMVAEGECEILNVAVAPGFRRRGIARDLLSVLLRTFAGVIFLEVRESNQAAQNLYQSLGFQRVGIRPDYYREPPEHGIVLKFHSC